MALSPDQFASLFGVPDGDSQVERVKASKAVFQHIGDAIVTGHALGGRALSAWEVWTRLSQDQVVELARDGRVRLPLTLADVGKDLTSRRAALGLSIRHVARHATLTDKIARRIEDGSWHDILAIERYAATLGLEEYQVGISRLDTAGDLAVRLRNFGQGDPRRGGLSPAAVVTLSSASWVSATQTRLRRWQGLPADDWRREFLPDDDYGGVAHEPWEAGFRLARRTRQKLGIGPDEPVESMRRLVEERLHIPLIQAELPQNIAGATLSHGEGRAIIVNTSGDNENEWVRRATIAHELGHLLWDPDERLKHLIVDSYRTLSGGARYYDPIEARANAFAVEFLCPRSAVEREMGREPLAVALRTLMVQYGVSMTAARQHMWNTHQGFDLKSLRAEASPTDDWKARESFTADWFPVRATSLARRGAFAGLTAQAALEGHISEATAECYLESKGPLGEELQTIREIYADALRQSTQGNEFSEQRLLTYGEDASNRTSHPLIANHQWLTTHSRAYASRWVALCGGDLIADSETLSQLETALSVRGLALEDVHFLKIGADFAGT